MFGKDKESYPRFYRMVPITEQVVDGYVALIKELNWNRVAVISYDDDFNIDVCSLTRLFVTKSVKSVEYGEGGHNF